MTTKIITGCNNCPFCIWGSINAYCAVIKNNSESPILVPNCDFDNVVTPTWCPLKINPIIVTYES